MNMKSKLKSVWDEIIDNSINLPINLQYLENNLTDFFQKEGERIETDYCSGDAKQDNRAMQGYWICKGSCQVAGILMIGVRV